MAKKIIPEEQIVAWLREGKTSTWISEQGTTMVRIARIRREHNLRPRARTKAAAKRQPAWVKRGDPRPELPVCKHCQKRHIMFHVCRPLADHRAKLERERLEAERERAPLFIDRPEVTRFNDVHDNQYAEQGGNLWLKKPEPLRRYATLPGGE